jgi:uncharacterized protein
MNSMLIISYVIVLLLLIVGLLIMEKKHVSFSKRVFTALAFSSFGVEGVGGGETFDALIVLSVLNLPIAVVGLLISVEPLIGMGRTALNVSGSLTVGILTSKATGEFEEEVYQQSMAI